MFVYKIEPRFCETDALGHISNTALPKWFEHGREPIFRMFNPALSIADWNLILKKMEVDFMAQIYLFKPVEIRTSLSQVGNSSFGVHQEAWQDGRQVAAGDCVMVHFDYAAQKSAPIPDDIRAQLQAHLAG